MPEFTKAKTFREAADEVQIMGLGWARLLVHAAQQSEQLDTARARIWEMREYLAGRWNWSDEMKAFWHGPNPGPDDSGEKEG